MSGKKHDAVFDDVLADIDADAITARRTSTRFLKRSTALGEQRAGAREEKVLHWVDPATCRMWARHNRDYSLLTEATCRDLIDGIRAQGQQEFPAIVRRLEGEDHAYEVICGARRHFAVSWLRGNNYPQFKYLIEVRDLTDEEAFRLADIENRDRDDISDYERARDYASAVALYYGGKQKAMAARLDVSEAWLSRYLQMAKLPVEIVSAFATIRDIRELHARGLKPLLAGETTRTAVLAEAGQIAADQAAARDGQGVPIEAAKVLTRLKAAAAGGGRGKPVPQGPKRYDSAPGEPPITAKRGARKTVLELPDKLTKAGAKAAFDRFLMDRFGAD